MPTWSSPTTDAPCPPSIFLSPSSRCHLSAVIMTCLHTWSGEEMCGRPPPAHCVLRRLKMDVRLCHLKLKRRLPPRACTSLWTAAEWGERDGGGDVETNEPEVMVVEIEIGSPIRRDTGVREGILRASWHDLAPPPAHGMEFISPWGTSPIETLPSLRLDGHGNAVERKLRRSPHQCDF